jgi:S1-C subfamily serine protease
MAMFIVRYIFPVLLLLCASQSYANITKEKIERFYESIVSVRSIVSPEARTAVSLGVEREGNGVAIDENHILTIGYIVIESESIEIGLSDGRRLPAKLVGYDHTSGFGIIKSVVPLEMQPLQLGNSDNINSEQDLLILPSSNRGAGSIVRSVSRRPFTGWWEYFVESPIYTTPPNGLWAGAPILNENGEILGIGSLFVSESVPGISSPGNMSVPINLLKPILEDLKSSGRRKSKTQPYLGISSDDSNDQVIVTRVSKSGPAFEAGIRPQDVIMTINGSQISDLKSFYEKIWKSGEAGVTIELSVLRSGTIMTFDVKTVDRLDHFFKPQSF